MPKLSWGGDGKPQFSQKLNSRVAKDTAQRSNLGPLLSFHPMNPSDYAVRVKYRKLNKLEVAVLLMEEPVLLML